MYVLKKELNGCVLFKSGFLKRETIFSAFISFTKKEIRIYGMRKINSGKCGIRCYNSMN